MDDNRILIGRGERPVYLDLRYANRHGLIAGATGTGKTVSLQILAEAFSRAGVPVFCADVKGDLSGLARPGEPDPKIEERAARLGVRGFAYEPAPVIFWDLFRKQGHPVRATVSEMGPLLLSRLLGLNETQQGVLYIAFRVADDEGLLLLDLDDLRAMLTFVAEHAADIGAIYGHVKGASIGAIQRRLLVLEDQGGRLFFGEPALELEDLMLRTPDGRGAVNVLMADELMTSPKVYATFLLWLLAELFEELPEVGDPDRPKLVFFFDEAHLLFRDAPPALLEKIEQVVRLIRSKGVGVYFVTQSPNDIPEPVLRQLGNRIQHALRAYTPAERRALRAAADSFRPNPTFETAEVLPQLAVGEALVSTLGERGVPSVVERAHIVPPRSRMGSIGPEERRAVIERSPLFGKYEQDLERESAYELLAARSETVIAEEEPAAVAAGPAPVRDTSDPWGGVRVGGIQRRPPTPREVARRRRRLPHKRKAQPKGLLSDLLVGSGRREGIAQAVAKSVARSVGYQIGRAVVRGIFGSLFKR